MEYIHDHGTYADIPVEQIIDGWNETYGHERVRKWIKAFEASGGKLKRKLENEEWLED